MGILPQSTNNPNKTGITTIGLFLEAAKRGRFSYTYSGRGDINNDGVPTNDLIFVPISLDQIDLEAYNINGQSISVEAQWQALDNFIKDSEYLSTRRGQFAERNGSAIPFFLQIDLRLMQAFNFQVRDKKIPYNLVLMF